EIVLLSSIHTASERRNEILPNWQNLFSAPQLPDVLKDAHCWRLPLTRHDATLVQSTRQNAMAERTADVQAHWTRPGVLARIDAALTELGHDPQKLNPEILATVEHLHSGALPPLASRLSGLHLRRTAGFSMLGRAATSFSRCPGPLTPRSISSTLKT